MTLRALSILVLAAALALASAWWFTRPSGLGSGAAPARSAASPADSPEQGGGAALAIGADDVRQFGGAGGSGDAPAPQGPKGRVLSLSSQAGVGGIPVRLFHGGESVERVITALDGRFAFQSQASSGDWVEAGPDHRFHFEPARHGISGPAEGSGSVELILGARRLPAAPATGLVLDLRTQEPVPHYQLWIHDSMGTDEGFTTDAQGRFEGSQTMAVGPRRIIAVDSTTYGGTYQDRKLEVHNPGEDMRITVEVGPTYRLLMALPENHRVESFLVQVRCSDNATPASGQPTQSTRLRPGEPPWVRLSMESLPSVPGGDELVVISENGLLRGRAPVRSTVGIQAQPIPIQLQPSGTLRGRLLDQEGEVPVHPRLILTSTVDDRRFEVVPDSGNFRIPGLEPGDYRLEAHGRGIHPFAQDVHIRAGEVEVVVCRVRARKLSHRLSGTLRTRSGRRVDGLEVNLVDRQDEAWPAEVHWVPGTASGHAQARFQADELPAGFYTATAGRTDGTLSSTCQPSGIFAQPRGEALQDSVQLLVHDPPPGGPVRVRLRSLETGAPIDGRVSIHGADWTLDADTEQGVAAFDSVPAKGADWTALAQVGHFGVVGATGARVRLAGDGIRVLELEVPRGWNGAFRVTRSDGSLVGGGLHLMLDGRSSAPCDSLGFVLHSAQARPKHLTVGGSAYLLLDSSDVEASTGTFRAGARGTVDVRVRRATR